VTAAISITAISNIGFLRFIQTPFFDKHQDITQEKKKMSIPVTSGAKMEFEKEASLSAVYAMSLLPTPFNNFLCKCLYPSPTIR
jgi:hypothetical protein